MECFFVLLKRFYFFFFIFFSAGSLFSCVDYKKLTYFNDISDSTSKVILNLPEYKSPLIKKDDFIFISIQTIDPNVNKLLNSANISSFSTSINANATPGNTLSGNTGYLVDNDGEVDLPVIGKIKISGLTTAQARKLIKQSAEPYFKDAIIDVRFANFQITVLGEVNRPSNYLIPTERVSIIDAIGMAGDLTLFGKRGSVLLIRNEEDNDSRKLAVRLNLSSKSLFSSPYFYLRPNDILYVEPNKSRVAGTDLMQARYITIATSILSLLIILFTRLI